MNLKRPAFVLTQLLTLARVSQAAATSSQAPTSNASLPIHNPLQDPLQNLDYTSMGSKQTTMSSPSPSRRAPVISISHGGGPMPVLGDPSHREITHSLRTKVPSILKLGTAEQPRAIVLVTAHWSARNPTISGGKKHSLYYDYGGFPREAYKLRYDAPGSPEVAGEVERVFKEVGLRPEIDETRGWDHGVFIPLLLINPSANIPIVQVSVLDSEDPADHYNMGRALSSLREANIAIIGSGFASLHNLGAMFTGATKTPAFKTKNEAWSRRVTEAATMEGGEEREEAFRTWRTWPAAYDMHPRGGAEHFLPLIVCAGAGGEDKGKGYSDEFMGLDMWSYYWE